MRPKPSVQANNTSEIPTVTTRGSSTSTISDLRQSILNTKLRIGEDSTLLQNYDAKLAELHAEAVAMPE